MSRAAVALAASAASVLFMGRERNMLRIGRSLLQRSLDLAATRYRSTSGGPLLLWNSVADAALGSVPVLVCEPGVGGRSRGGAGRLQSSRADGAGYRKWSASARPTNCNRCFPLPVSAALLKSLLPFTAIAWFVGVHALQPYWGTIALQLVSWICAPVRKPDAVSMRGGRSAGSRYLSCWAGQASITSSPGERCEGDLTHEPPGAA